MKNISKIGLLIVITLNIVSCSKDNEVNEFNEDLNNLKASEEIFARSTEYSKLSDLFKNLDTQILDKGSDSEKENYLISVNSEIKSYLVKNYPNEVGEVANIDSSDMTIFHLGLVHALAEENNFQELNGQEFANRGASWFQCAWYTISAAYSIEGLYNAYVTLFTQGASWSTVWPVVKNMVRRYAGWVAVALIGYEIATECF